MESTDSRQIRTLSTSLTGSAGSHANLTSRETKHSNVTLFTNVLTLVSIQYPFPSVIQTDERKRKTLHVDVAN